MKDTNFFQILIQFLDKIIQMNKIKQNGTYLQNYLDNQFMKNI